MTAADDVWAAMTAVYAGAVAGDADAIDRLLADDVTIWDSGEAGLVRGLGELRALRSRRPAGGSSPVALDAQHPLIDVWGDLALVRHILVVRFDDGSEQRIRNTSVWRHIDGAWRAVHNHEDVLPD